MATSIVMPQMGYDMREGTVVRWHKREGETVARGEVLADIETDKATVEFEAYTGGVVGRIVAAEGMVVPVGELIAIITAPGEALPEDDLPALPPDAAPTDSGAESTPSSQPAASPSGTGTSDSGTADEGRLRASPIARRLARERGIDLGDVNGTGPGGRIVEKDVLEYQPPTVPSEPPGGVRASPLARRLARERGIDLSEINGTGPGGRIVEKDVLEYSPPAPVPATVSEASSGPGGGAAAIPAEAAERVDLSRMRQAIARVTSDSKRDAPHFYVTAEIDMGRAMSLRQEINDAVESDSRVTVNDLIVRACALALGGHPKFNASFSDGALEFHPQVNIGIAIALEAGLIVPGIANCQEKSLVELAAASKDLIQRAHSGHLRNDEYSSTTFSVSNLGMFDVESFAAIIYPPHAAVLAVGSVKEQPVVRDGQLAVGQMMKATLSTDHRVADGSEAAQFLMEVKRVLENPVTLLL